MGKIHFNVGAPNFITFPICVIQGAFQRVTNATKNHHVRCPQALYVV